MDPLPLHFDVRDIFRAPRLALSGKKIWIFMVGNFAAFVLYWIFTHIALAAAGRSFSESWNEFGLYPYLNVGDFTVTSCLIYTAGIVFALISVTLACTAVSRVTYKQLKGDDFYSSGDAWKYVRKHWHPVVFTSVAVVLIVVFFVLMAMLFAFFGKIPYIGEFLFSLPYLLYFFGALFTLYSSVVLIIALVFTPAIVGAYEEDTMGTVFQSYSITWSQPWRVVAYSLVLYPIACLAVGIFYCFWKFTYEFINIVFGYVMDDKLDHLVDTATAYVCPPLFELGAIHSMSATESISAVILAFFLFTVMLMVIGYAFSTIVVGKTLMFVIFKKKTDDDNLLERKDEDELDAEEDEDFSLESNEEEDDETEPGPDEKDESDGESGDEIEG